MEFFHRPEDPAIGYWSPRTSAVDWCEPNYAHSFYVAEFFNTITNFPAIFLALQGLWFTYKYGYEKRYYLVNLLVCFVGIGSALFHGTLLYTGQILDELPMVYTSLALLYAILELDSSNKKSTNKYLGLFLIAYGLSFTAVYLYLPSFFIFFLVGYIMAILLLIYHSAMIYRRPTTLSHQKMFVLLAVGFYVGGWLGFWVPEILFCETLQVFNFHSFWHLTSTFGAFVMVIFLIFQRELTRGRKPELNYNSFLGIKLIPFVHIPTLNEKNNSNNNYKNKIIEKVVTNHAALKKRSTIW